MLRLGVGIAVLIAAAVAQAQTITSEVGHHQGDGYPRAVAKINPAALGCWASGHSLVVGDERTYQPRLVDLAAGGVTMTYPAPGAAYAGIAVAPNGDIYASDPYLHLVWRLPAGGGIAERYAGVQNGGLGGFSGDGGPATAAMLNSPTGVAIGSDGALYIADTSNMRIRRVDPATRVIATFAGGNSGCANGVCDGGPATSARLSQPVGVEAAPSGDVYIAERLNQRVRVVRAATGKIETFAGNGQVGLSGDGGLATAATLTQPGDVAVGPDGSVYIADTKNHAVRRVRPDGVIERVAGTGQAGSGADGTAITSRLDTPRTVEWCMGRLWVGESGAAQRVRAIDIGSIPPPPPSPSSTPTRTPALVAFTPTRSPTSTPTVTITPTYTQTATPTCACCAQCG